LIVRVWGAQVVAVSEFEAVGHSHLMLGKPCSGDQDKRKSCTQMLCMCNHKHQGDVPRLEWVLGKETRPKQPMILTYFHLSWKNRQR
jgi:hypothetical protein